MKCCCCSAEVKELTAIHGLCQECVKIGVRWAAYEGRRAMADIPQTVAVDVPKEHLEVVQRG
jgi:hypothetical protein